MTSFLERIVAHKRRELAERETECSEGELEALAERAPAPRPVVPRWPADSMAVIAEVKRASPSKGAIAVGLDAVEQARNYADGGADAISVLTDHAFYRGSLDDLRDIRDAVATPVMRKDFILNRYGLLEARAAGADMVLLIVAVLGAQGLRGLMESARALGLTALVEVYAEDEASIAIEAGADLVGINNRNLHTFEVSLETTERLAPLLVESATVVSLSGMSDASDVRRVGVAGARAVLVGEALVRSPDPGAVIRAMRAVPLVTPHAQAAGGAV